MDTILQTKGHSPPGCGRGSARENIVPWLMLSADTADGSLQGGGWTGGRAHLLKGGPLCGGEAEARMHGERECERDSRRQLREGRMRDVLVLRFGGGAAVAARGRVGVAAAEVGLRRVVRLRRALLLTQLPAPLPVASAGSAHPWSHPRARHPGQPGQAGSNEHQPV